jgi:ankyrin repeat protein
LFLAAQQDVSLSLLESLLENGADPDKAKVDGATPLYVAAQQNVKFQIVEALLQRGANPNSPLQVSSIIGE